MKPKQTNNKPVQEKLFHVFSRFNALLMAILLVIFLSSGNSSQNSKVQKRAKKLSWFQAYLNNQALLKNPQRFLFGAFDNNSQEGFQSLMSLEDSLKSTFPLIHIYTAWGGKPEEAFPSLQVKNIVDLGSIPLITWEPWLTDFDPDQYPQLRKLEERDKGGMADIAAGKYDFYISRWANDAKKVNAQIFLRVGHDMNDPRRFPWGLENNSPKDFVAAWKHIHDVFKKEGVTNVIWVWSPHPSYGYMDLFYPGDGYVDYVGVSALNYGTIASWSKWWTFQDIFGNYYKDLVRYKKPIMITEFGCLATGGNRSAWFSEALDSMPLKYPAVKAIVFFHYADDKTISPQSINWSFKNDPATIHVITRQVQRLSK